jgi:uncharacterized protein with FMN-binding domain
MKKYLASGGLIIASLIYVLSQQVGASNAAETLTTTQPMSAATRTPVGKAEAPPASSITSPGPTPRPAPTPLPAPTPKPTVGMYRDGSYTGSISDAYYGYVQVRAIVSGGKLASVDILQYPNDRSTSRYINGQALPYLRQEALQAQSAHVDTISGASDTSAAFRESLGAALSRARA